MSRLSNSAGSACTDDLELDLARQIQSVFVPDRCHGWPGVHLANRRIAGSGLGGDFHNVIRGLDEQYSLVVGTVTGPGLIAAYAKALLSGAVRKFGPISRSPQQLVGHLSRLLSRINADLRDQRVTCSVFHGVVDRAAGTLEYCNAGCCHPLAVRVDGSSNDLRSTEAALCGSTTVECASETLDIASLRRLIIHTEGLTTARSASDDCMGPGQGQRLLLDTADISADEQVEAVLGALRKHVGLGRAFVDDVTILVAEFAERPAVPVVDAMRTRWQTCGRATGAVPDSSVFLG